MMRNKLFIIVVFILLSCYNKKKEKFNTIPNVFNDSIQSDTTVDNNIEFVTDKKNHVIHYYKNGFQIGVIFMNENKKTLYPGNSFTPTKKQIKIIEQYLSEIDEDFNGYFRQYLGRDFSKNNKYIFVLLIPKKRAENLYPYWKQKFIKVDDDIYLRKVSYHINSGKFELMRKSNL